MRRQMLNLCFLAMTALFSLLPCPFSHGWQIVSDSVKYSETIDLRPADYPEKVAQGKSVQLPDGRIVASSSHVTNGTSALLACRFTADGEPDVSFGISGIASFDSPQHEVIRDFAIQTNGYLMGVGNQWQGINDEWIIANITTNGELNTSFGSGGIVVFSPLGRQYEEARRVALQADGKIIVVGHSGTPYSANVLARFDDNGNLDTSFGTAGVSAINLGQGDIFALDLKVDSADRIYVLDSPFLARYTPSGGLDATFASGGILEPTSFVGRAMLIDSNGKLVLVGSDRSTPRRAIITRYDTTGTIDATFGSGGRTVVENTATSTQDSYVMEVTQASIGGYHLALSAFNGTNVDCVICYVDGSGNLDTSMGDGGLMYTRSDPSLDLVPTGIGETSNGIVVGGLANRSIFIAKHTPDVDGDGIPNWWEHVHFGDSTSADPNADPDGDSYTNLEEFRNETDPQEFDVGPAMIWTAVEVGWKSVAGTNYQVQYCEDLETANWLPLYEVIGNGMEMAVLESTRRATSRFYRIVVTNDLTESLVAFYPFDGSAADVSGNENHGAVSGASLTLNRMGKPNSAYHFDGVMDHITIPPSPTLNLGSNGFSLAAWVKPDKVYDTSANNDELLVVVADGAINTREYSYAMVFAESNLHIKFAGSSSYPNSQLQDKKFLTTFETNTWYQITVVYDGDMVSGYVNGTLISTEDVDDSVKPYDLTDYIIIGGRPDIAEHGHPRSDTDYNVEFQGVIDDVRIYNRALSFSEVQRLYHLQE